MTYEVSWRRFRAHKNELQTKKLVSYANAILSLLKKYDNGDLSDMTSEDKLKILDRSERLSLAIRCSLELKEENKILESVPEGYKLSQVAISLEGKKLKIETPLTTVRGANNSSYIANCVIAALDVFEQENSLQLSDIFAEPVSVTQIRKITESQFSGIGTIKDNTNEDSKIINAILYDKFLKADSVYYLRSFTNTTKTVKKIDEVGMDFIIAPYVNI